MPQKRRNAPEISKWVSSEQAFRLVVANELRPFTSSYPNEYGAMVQGLQGAIGFSEEQAANYSGSAIELLASNYRFGECLEQLFDSDKINYLLQTEQVLELLKTAEDLGEQIMKTPEFELVAEKDPAKEKLIETLASQGITAEDSPYSNFVLTGLNALTRGVLALLYNPNDESGVIADRGVYATGIPDLKALLTKVNKAAQQNAEGVRKYMEDLPKLDIPVKETQTTGLQEVDPSISLHPKVAKAINSELHGLDHYVALAETGMLQLVDARATAGTSLYDAVLDTRIDLDKLVAQGIKPSGIGNVLGSVHKIQQPTFFELLKANPEYISAFGVIQSCEVLPSNYAQFLQKRADKEISFGDKTQTAFEYVMAIATKGDQSVAKQLIEAKNDWTTYAHLDELYQLARRGVLVPVVQAYLRYGAKKEPNKQEVMLQAARLKASEEEVKTVSKYMESMHDDDMNTIADQKYNGVDALVEALKPTEQPRVYEAQEPTAPQQNRLHWLEALCCKPGIQEGNVRSAYQALMPLGHCGTLKKVSEQYPQLVNRFARFVGESAGSPHLKMVLGNEELFSANISWLERKPESLSLDHALKKVNIADGKYVQTAYAALMRR